MDEGQTSKNFDPVEIIRNLFLCVVLLVSLEKKDAPATMTKINLYVNNSKIDWHTSTYVLYG